MAPLQVESVFGIVPGQAEYVNSTNVVGSGGTRRSLPVGPKNRVIFLLMAGAPSFGIVEGGGRDGTGAIGICGRRAATALSVDGANTSFEV